MSQSMLINSYRLYTKILKLHPADINLVQLQLPVITRSAVKLGRPKMYENSIYESYFQNA